MRHLMVDLETLDSATTATIVSIGAVFFDPESQKLGPQFKVNVKAQTAQDAGLTISASTVEWWFKQSAEARASLYTPTPIELKPALIRFDEFYKLHGQKDKIGNAIAYVWGNGATFDNVILRHAYAKAVLACPWSFRYDSCFRTLKNQ